MEIDTLICAGGGVKCIGTIGALKVLDEQGILKTITKYAGTSAGSIIITLLNIGYTPQEIYDTVFCQTNSIVQDSLLRLPYNLIANYGMYSGDKMVVYLGTLFEKKGFDKNITLNDLQKKTNKTLVITATSLNTRNTYFFNHYTFPDVKVIDAVRMSMSIPFYFTSVNYKIDGVSHRFVDGGILNNFPLYYFDISELHGEFIKTYNELSDKYSSHVKTNDLLLKYNFNTIGIMLLDEDNSRDVYSYFKGFDKIANVCDFIGSFLNTILNKIDQDNFNNPVTGAKAHFFDRTITVTLEQQVSAIDFNLTEQVKQSIMEQGQNSARDFFLNQET
jgi:NTE family protein